MKLLTLGGLELSGARFTQPKPLLLLAHLALEGPQPRERLAKLFWPEGEGRKSLSMALTRLRAAVGELVAADEHRVWTRVESDVQALLEALGRGDWQGAARRYSGAFLDGVGGAWHEELEEWVYSTRDYLGERVQGALLELAEGAARGGDVGAACGLAERAYRLPGAPPPEPGRLEGVYRLLVAGGSGLVAEVRRELLSYGIATTLTPEAARAALKPPAAPSRLTPSALPLRATSFVGREGELLELGQTLAQPTCQLLTLLGSAGAGKTRLALEFAHAQLASGGFPDGVFFVALETLQAGTFLPALAQTLGCALSGAPDVEAQLASCLGAKRLLVVLDNAEHLKDALSPLSPLVRRCPGLKLLVTSRVRLGLEEEHLMPLGGLSFPEPAVTDPHRAQAFGAVQLFQRRAKQLRPDFSLAGELADVLALCRLLGGSPLGLELAAGWVRLMSCAEIVREIARDLDFLDDPNRNLPERHRSLRAAFEGSWRLLSDREREALTGLAVFQGGFSREAAAEVAGATIPVLRSLVDASLVHVRRDGRFEQHPLIARYAGVKGQAQGARWQELRARHAAFYVRLAREQQAAVAQGRQQGALRVLQAETENLRALFAYSLERRDLEGVPEWLEQLELLHDVRGSYAEALEFLERAEAVLAGYGSEARAVIGGVRATRAWFELRLGRYEDALRTVRTALGDLLGDGGVRWRVSALNTLGILERRTGAYGEARHACEEGLSLARAQGDELGVARMLASLADIEQALGDDGAAERHFLEAIALYERRGQVVGVVRNLNNLGWLLYVQGRGPEAEAVFERGLRRAREIDFRQTLPYLLNNLGYLAFDAGRFGEARRLNEEALEIARATGERAVEAEVLISLARISLASEQGEAASRYADAALELAWSAPYLSLTLQALVVTAELRAASGDAERAAGLGLLVEHHPAVTGLERTLARALLERLAADLSAEQRARAEAFSRATSLQEAVEGLAHRAERVERSHPPPARGGRRVELL